MRYNSCKVSLKRMILKMILEVVGTNLEDVIAAEKFGANRVELCQGMTEHGITPSYGLIKNAVEAVDIPINVIVRPHSNSFHYNEEDILTMLADIEIIKQVGANGVVLGPLTRDDKVDEPTLQRLLEAADGLDVVFHRAFDFVADQFEALETILKYKQIKTILTCGGGDVPATENIDQIKKLIDKTRDTHLTLMPGYGMRPETVGAFYEATKPDAIHFGTGVRKDFSFLEPFDAAKIAEVKRITR